MIETSVAWDGRDLEEQEREEGRDFLYDVLAALPFIERVELIERMAERMGV